MSNNSYIHTARRPNSKVKKGLNQKKSVSGPKFTEPLFKTDFEGAVHGLEVFAIRNNVISPSDSLVNVSDVNCAFGEQFKTPEEVIAFASGVKAFGKAPAKASYIPEPDPNEPKERKHVHFNASKDFLQSSEWRTMREYVFKLLGYQCCKCGIEYPEKPFCISHVKPRSQYPDLALDLTNLQVLCTECTKEKGVKTVDYRSQAQREKLKRAAQINQHQRY